MDIPRITFHTVTSSRFLATLLLLTFSFQLIPIEGYEISFIKVSIMSICPLIFLFKVPFITKALINGFLFWIICLFASLMQEDIRFSTIGYSGLFLITFITFYNLIHQGAFNLKYLTRLLKFLIYSYTIVLIFQQLAILLGFTSIPLINYVTFLDRGIGANSLSIEPSHSACLVTTFMLSYWRCFEIINGKKLSLRELFSTNHKKVTISFLWAMLTMGSGTAFVCLGLLCLYFIKRNTFLYVIPLFLILFSFGQFLEIKSMNRAFDAFQYTIQGDMESLTKHDQSASIRIVPLYNSIAKLDLAQKETWFGKGTMERVSDTESLSKVDRKLKTIDQYGLIAYIMSLILVYSCIIKNFFSIETLFFVIVLHFTITNEYICWCPFMLFSTIGYFQKKQNFS